VERSPQVNDVGQDTVRKALHNLCTRRLAKFLHAVQAYGGEVRLIVNNHTFFIANQDGRLRVPDVGSQDFRMFLRKNAALPCSHSFRSPNVDGSIKKARFRFSYAGQIRCNRRRVELSC